jgi:hypothetical protein
MVWFRAARDKIVPPEQDLTAEREEAAETRERIEESLRNEQARTVEVSQIAAVSRRIRAHNHFAARIIESFRGQGHNGTSSG